MTIQFAPHSLTLQANKTTTIAEPLDADAARKTLREIASDLTDGKSVKSGYLRLHIEKDSPTLSRGGGHVRSGYSAARSLVEQLVHTAYGADSPAAASLQSYLSGRTKIGTRSLVKLVATMEAETALELARFRELKKTRLQAPLQGAAPTAATSQMQRLQKAERDLEHAIAPLTTPTRYRSPHSRLAEPTAQIEDFERAMGKINEARASQQERLDLCRSALAAGAIDPFAQMASTDASLIQRFFNPDIGVRQKQHEQIVQGMQADLDPGQIAEQVGLDPGLVASQMLDIALDQQWREADQRGFVTRLLQQANGDSQRPLSEQAEEVDALLTPDRLQWYAQLRSQGLPADVVQTIEPLVLRRLAEKHAQHDPLLSKELPADARQLKADMKAELIQEMADLIVEADKRESSTFKPALNEARSRWLSQARQTPQARQFLTPWRDERPVQSAGSTSVIEGMLRGRMQTIEQIRQESIHELLDGISRQWDGRRLSGADQVRPGSDAFNAQMQAYERVLGVAQEAMQQFDPAHETETSHRQRLNNLDLFQALHDQVQVAQGRAPGINITDKLQALNKRTEMLAQRQRLDGRLEEPVRDSLLKELAGQLSVQQRELSELLGRSGPLDEDALQALAQIQKAFRLTQEALVRHAAPLADIAEDFAGEAQEELGTQTGRVQTPPSGLRRDSPAEAKASQTSPLSAGASPASRSPSLSSRLAELQRIDPERYVQYMDLSQKTKDAQVVGQWLDAQRQSGSGNPAVIDRLKNGIRQKTELFGQQMQTLLDSESGRLDGRTRLTPEIGAQVLAEDRSRFWVGPQFQAFLTQLLNDPVGRASLLGQSSLEGAIDELTKQGATVEVARNLINMTSQSFTQWQVDEADRVDQVPGASQGANPGEQVLKRIGGKRIANAGDGHCLFLSFGHFQDPKAAGPSQAGKKSQQDLIRRERQGLLDQSLRLSEAQYPLMGTDPRSKDLDKAESVERLLIGLDSGVGTDERGWGWVGHFPLKAMQAQRPVLLISEDGKTRAWGPDGQEIKLSASESANRSLMGQGQVLLGLAKDKTHNPQGAAPIVVFNRHNHFEAVQVP